MAKTNYVLQALSILGLEEILKLAEALKSKQSLKKAVGEELVLWDDAPKKDASKSQKDADVLPFNKKSITEFAEYKEPPPPKGDEKDDPKVVTSDLLLWQREMAREHGGNVQKADAMKGYQKATQMYVVKSQTSDGKEKIRFASTNGVLVNKKQA